MRVSNMPDQTVTACRVNENERDALETQSRFFTRTGPPSCAPIRNSAALSGS